MKQKLLTTLFTVCLALCSWANGTEIDGICYELDSDAQTASVTYTGTSPYSGNEYTGDITIPSTVSSEDVTYTVTAIGDYAFYGCEELTSVEIPNTVTSIGQLSFTSCYGLTSINIPASVTTILRAAFADCTNLESISVDESNTILDSRDNCNAIINTAENILIVGCKNTTIPNSVASIGERAFYYCEGLTTLAIPNSVTTIEDGAFSNCIGLTDVTLSNTLTSIGEEAFSGCTGLTSVEFPKTLQSIGDYAFYGCTGLKSVTSNSQEPPTLGEQAFEGTVFLPAGSALIACPDWTEVEDPARVQIEVSAFTPNHYRLISPFYAMEPDYADEGYHIDFYYDTENGFDMDEGIYYIGETYQGNDIFLYYYPSYYSSYCSLTNEGNVFTISALFGAGNSLYLPNPITFTWDEGFPGEVAAAPRRVAETMVATNSKKDKNISSKVLGMSLQQSNTQTQKAKKILKDEDETESDDCILHVPAGTKDAYNAAWNWPIELIAEMDATSIEKLSNITKSAKVINYYNLQGQRISQPQRGQLVIARCADGTSRKVLLK